MFPVLPPAAALFLNICPLATGLNAVRDMSYRLGIAVGANAEIKAGRGGGVGEHERKQQGHITLLLLRSR
ncbi:hypothetical protein XENTR_v10023746 [Xenopus tropicalis]|nr:hypothetical protein XENTR_v10023746 [Xenopus tropicalis]